MPKAEGNSHETAFQNIGMLDDGHDTPERNTIGTDMNTKIMMQSSRR